MSNMTFHRNIIPLLLLSVLFAACEKDNSATYASVDGLKGKWAPIHDNWLTDRYLAFEKGTLSTHKLYETFLAKDGKIWSWSQYDIDTVINVQPYRISDGILYVGRNNLGACRIQNDTLLLGKQKYMRILEMTGRHFTHLCFADNMNPQTPTLTTGKAAKTITIPCYMADAIPWFRRITIGTPSNRLNDIRIQTAASVEEKDSLTFSIDENTANRVENEQVYFYHPATGVVALVIQQLPTVSGIRVDYVDDNERTLRIGSGANNNLVVHYHLIDPSTPDDTIIISVEEEGQWLKVHESVSATKFSLGIEPNNTEERKAILKLHYPGAEDYILTIIQRGSDPDE